jgi:hypothetical protein
MPPKVLPHLKKKQKGKPFVDRPVDKGALNPIIYSSK